MTRNRDHIRILVAQAQGSAPREAGAVMRVWVDGFDGTVGGGALEFEAIAVARALLAGGGIGAWHRELRTYPLGPALGQCCGGVVRLLFEAGWGQTPLPKVADHIGVAVRSAASGTAPVTVRDRAHTADWPVPVLRAVRAMLSGERPRETLLLAGAKGAPAWVIEPEPRARHRLYLYGAGHVGRAVVRALRDLPFAVTWVDTSAERFPDWVAALGSTPHPVPLPKGEGTIEPKQLQSGSPLALGEGQGEGLTGTPRPDLATIVACDPAAIAVTAPPDALHLIMTFSHPLDLAITAAVLARPFAWAGLIGSATKRARFEKRLREGGIGEHSIRRLHCPIGIGGITGKEPAVIAISVAAQLAAFVCAGAAAETVHAQA